VDDIQNSQFQLPSTSITGRCKTIRSIIPCSKDVKDVERYLSGTLKAAGNELRLDPTKLPLIMNPGKWMQIT
jgi:hypothetical protein